QALVDHLHRLRRLAGLEDRGAGRMEDQVHGGGQALPLRRFEQVEGRRVQVQAGRRGVHPASLPPAHAGVSSTLVWRFGPAGGRPAAAGTPSAARSPTPPAGRSRSWTPARASCPSCPFPPSTRAMAFPLRRRTSSRDSWRCRWASRWTPKAGAPPTSCRPRAPPPTEAGPVPSTFVVAAGKAGRRRYSRPSLGNAGRGRDSGMDPDAGLGGLCRPAVRGGLVGRPPAALSQPAVAAAAGVFAG